MKISHGAKIAIRWLREQEPTVLASVFLVIAITWGFIEIVDEVLEGSTQAFDRWMVRAMRQPHDLSVPIGPKWVQEMGRDATALGGIAVLTLFTLVVAGYLWLDRKARMALFLLAATLSGLGLSFALKYFFARPRPDVVPHLSHVATSSFPSGHSMLSAVVYLTLGTLLAATVKQTKLKAYVLGVAMLLSGIVGVSRVYMGVHYPTDVLAGWMAGLLWALSCWLLARVLQKKHQVEEEG